MEDSPLPSNAYGDEPSTHIFRHPRNRPRWVNAGMILGTASNMRAFYETMLTSADWKQVSDDQQPLNRMLANGSDLFTLDYFSQLIWTGGSDFDNLKFVPVPRPLSGIQSMIPYGADLPRLGMAGATGEIPVMLHFNMYPGAHFCLDDHTKEEAIKIALKQLWWSSGDERFRRTAQELLAAGRIVIHDEENKEYTYAEICGETVSESSFLEW